MTTDDDEFVVDITGLAGTLAPDGSATFNVSFHPEASGSRTGTLSITFTGSSTPAVVALSGNGTGGPPAGGCGCTSGGGALPERPCWRRRRCAAARRGRPA